MRMGRVKDPHKACSLKELKRVEITWHDAASRSDHVWDEFNALRTQNNDGLVECQTLGYLVRISKRSVTITQTRADNGKLANEWSIPRTSVMRIKIL